MTKKQPEPGRDSLGGVAAELEQDVQTFESLTARIAKLELTSEKEIRRAAELLGEAAESHRSFLQHLKELIVQIDGVRNRQNASAAALSDHATKLEARRETYQQLQERFVALGSEAGEINELVRQSAESGIGTPEDRDGTLTRLRSAQERLALSVDVAKQLVTDARASELVDLERQADALRQQLQSLSGKLSRVELALGREPAKA